MILCGRDVHLTIWATYCVILKVCASVLRFTDGCFLSFGNERHTALVKCVSTRFVCVLHEHKSSAVCDV